MLFVDFDCSNSYPTQAAGGGGGYGGDAGGYQPRRANPYAQQDDRSYEMSSVQGSTANLYPSNGGGGGGGDPMSEFYGEVRTVRPLFPRAWMLTAGR